MLGFNAVYVPGWDCHGLPIEHQVDKELGLDSASIDVRRAMDPVEKRRKCREYALRFIDIQRNEFKRLGVFGDWEHPYVTMAPDYQAIIAREFGRFVGRGLVHKGLKPVHWCMHCKTALAQAEVEYEDQRTPSIYVRFPLLGALPAAPNAPAPSLVIWTTTPWTLPANLAVAVHPDEAYVALAHGGETLVVAAKLADAFVATASLHGAREVGRVPGRHLVGLEYRHPWIDRTGKVAAASFVAMDTGTGLVHIAPGHGEEDYELGRSLGLKVYNPVDDDGRFVPGVERFAGLTVWDANPKIVERLLSAGTRCAKCGGAGFRKETDILDVWFDSGCSHAAVLETRPELRWPAEMYLEGSDQHRGWFQSSLLESVGTRGAPPYKSVITHGFFVDGEGRKMSKSLGNVIGLDDLLPKYGAEILRLWVAAEDYTQDIRVSFEILDRLSDAYRRIRNTFRFLLGNLGDFVPERDRQSYARLDELDRFILDRLGRLIGRVRRAYEEYEFHTVFHAVHNFCAVDLSAQYLDIIKDRLYTSAGDDPRRRAAQTACYDIFTALARLLAPILTFTAEEAWRYLPGARSESVHLERFPEEPVEWLDDRLAGEWSRLLEVRREVAKALETARARGLIGSGLEARVLLMRAPEDLPALLRAKRSLLPTLFIVSQVEQEAAPAKPAIRYESQEIPGLVVGVDKARGRKCQRCWTWSEQVGASRDHPELCERCLPVVTGRAR